MPSRLSSLLVRDGLIGVKRMERAFQRQVIYGGSLDTILLEMGLLDESSLCDYLSLATGLPPATKEQMETISSEATELCDEELARPHRVAPLAVDGDALRVLVCEPVDFAQLEDLADALDMAIQPLVAPEFRFHLIFSQAYQRSVDARFLKLAESVADIEPVRAKAAGSGNALPARVANVAAGGATPRLAKISEPPATEDGRLDEPNAGAVVEASSEPTPNDNPDREIVDVPLPPVTPDTESVRATMRMSSDAVAARLGAAFEARRISDAYRIVRPARVESSPTDSVIDEPIHASQPDELEFPPIDELEHPLLEAEHPPPVELDIPAPLEIDRPLTEPLEGELAIDKERGSDRFSASYNALTHIDSHGVLSGEIGDVPVELGPASAPASVETTPTGAVLEPLTVSEAEDLLSRAGDRDVIFSLLLRGISRVADYAALLAVQGGAAIGRMGLNHGAIDSERVRGILIPLGLPSPFQQVVQSASPYIGRLASGVDEVDSQSILLGGTMPPAVMLLPVVLRNRVVAIGVGHCGDAPIEVTEVAEVFRLAEAAARALGRLIRKAKSDAAESMASEGFASEPSRGRAQTDDPLGDHPLDPPSSVAPEAEAEVSGAAGGELEDRDNGGEEIADLRRGEDDGAIARVARSTPSGPIHDEELEELLDEIDGDDLTAARAAKKALLGRSAEVVPLLDDRFPGKLRVDRYEVGWRTIRAGQYGQMMDLVVKLGAACGPMLALKLRDPRRDIRYYAAVCAAELRPEAALNALVERLFDRDYGVRDIAIHALGGYPVRELENALVVARRALDSDDDERVMAASNALAVLGDLGAIPALLDVLESGRELAEPARRALRRLTAQDFGNTTKKWRAWWSKNRERPRVEWLLDSLAHKDDELRRRAVDDLRTLTGESFGFHADANKRDRETARRLWLEWWQASGRHRFAPAAHDERDRSTAKIPRL